MDKYSVEIIDDDTATVYTIKLTSEEYVKATTDKGYLNGILAKIKQGTIPSMVPRDIPEQGIPLRQKDPTYLVSQTNVEEPTDSWTNEGTLSFICEYEMYQDAIEKGKMKQKDAFQLISNNLKQKNFIINAKQCSTKLASLKRTYKKIKDHNNKSGNDRQTWQYYEKMDSIFSRKPWIQPVAVCCSRSEEQEEKKGSEEVPASQSKRKGQNTPLGKKIDEFVEESRRRREDRSRQHAEKMQRMDKLLEILERRSRDKE